MFETTVVASVTYVETTVVATVTSGSSTDNLSPTNVFTITASEPAITSTASFSTVDGGKGSSNTPLPHSIAVSTDTLAIDTSTTIMRKPTNNAGSHGGAITSTIGSSSSSFNNTFGVVGVRVPLIMVVAMAVCFGLALLL